MVHKITLTSEELTLIEQKRAEEKALLNSYDYYKLQKIEKKQERIDIKHKEAENKKKVYEGFYNSLIAVSPNFKLNCNKVSQKIVVDLYEVDEEGYEITMLYDKDENPKKRLKPKEKVTLDSYFYEIKLSYTGNVPEGYSYHVIATPINSKYGGRVLGYKMQIQGTGINSWDGKGKMVNPKSVVNKLVELSEIAFIRIENTNNEKLRQQRIEAAFQNKFAHLKDEGVQISITQGQFTLTYKNGIELKFEAYEHNSEVVFTNSKVKIPYNFESFEVDKLINALKNI